MTVRKQMPERIVPGHRLGRHVHHDPRSRAYAVVELDTAALVSVRHHRAIPVLDQGNLGSCTGNAMVGAIGTDPIHADLTGLLLSQNLDENLAVSIYSQATKIDTAAGEYPPTDTGSDGLSVCKIAQSLGYLSAYLHAFTLAAALTALQAGPVITGITWYSGMDTPDRAGRIRPTGMVRGGHELVVDEIDVTNRLVWLTNSWGLSWGLQGRACLSWDDWASLLADQGDVTVPLPLAVVPPPPPPVPASLDQALWDNIHGWAAARHVGANRTAAQAITAWATAKGLT